MSELAERLLHAMEAIPSADGDGDEARYRQVRK